MIHRPASHLKEPGKTGVACWTVRRSSLSSKTIRKARQFLEALGYQKSGYYEKYRTTYELEEALIMLDELPFGSFLEIEGETVEQIRAVSAKLHLNWSVPSPPAIPLFLRSLRKKMQLPFQDISFENFRDIRVTPADLNVNPADE